jgi:hypothetical protein
VILEEQLPSELEASSIPRCRDLPEVAAGEFITQVLELRVVERIERFSSELKSKRLFDLKLLEQGQIEVESTWSDDLILP